MQATLTRLYGHRVPLTLGLIALALGGAIARFPLAETVLVAGAIVVLVATFFEPLLGIGVALLVGPLRAWLEIVRPGIAPHVGQVVLLLALCAWGVRGLLRRELRLRLPPLLWTLVGFLFVGLLSLWEAVDIWSGTLEAVKWLQVLLVAMVLLDRLDLRRCETSGDRPVGVLGGDLPVALAIATLGAAALAQALVGLWQFVLRGDGVEAFAINDRLYRAYGTFQQPNPYAGMLGMIAALLVGLAAGVVIDAARSGEWRREWKVAALVGAPAGVIVVGLVASWSRGGWMAFGAALVMVVVLLPRRSRWGLALLVVATAVGFGLYAAGLLPESIAARLTGFLSYVRFEDVRGAGITDDNFSVMERMAHWQAALSMWRGRFWRGVGLGCYEAAYPDHRLINWPLPLGHAHNFYLNLLAEVGLPGLIAYLVWLGTQFVVLAIASRRLSGWERGIAIGLAAAWTHLAVHSLVDNLLVNNVHLHVGILVGLTAWAWSRAEGRHALQDLREIPASWRPRGSRPRGRPRSCRRLLAAGEL